MIESAKDECFHELSAITNVTKINLIYKMLDVYIEKQQHSRKFSFLFNFQNENVSNWNVSLSRKCFVTPVNGSHEKRIKISIQLVLLEEDHKFYDAKKDKEKTTN
ncbi:CLUMA_CG003910, isoform A [Clunio marinus]|uniref:CLUMA_CG003910, isoform A n=1 Tax=Clunio marinus TaxID=568069 RepID=A0A1J1HS33_9DIPT|nr:CLUMA_CG003910, isoform A [Clunio marinus]